MLKGSRIILSNIVFCCLLRKEKDTSNDDVITPPYFDELPPLSLALE